MRMLDQFTAESRRPYRFPAAWVVPFCRITGDDSLQRLLLGPNLAGALRVGEISIEAHRLREAVLSPVSQPIRGGETPVGGSRSK